ncbi:MAG: hypothetical protein ACXQT4_00415 [Methanotrichaceae archaeon]
MVEYYKLDKIFVEGTTYETPNDRFYVIKRIGTDGTSATKLVIDGVETGEIINEVAPLHRTSSNLLGPLGLGDLYYVVPPNKTFYIDGPSGAKVRAIGQIGKLAPGEALPADHASRFTDQGKHYLTYEKATATLAAASADWAADAETDVLSLTPKTVEEYIFNNVVMAKVENAAATPSEGDVAIRFYLEGTPLDILTTEPGKKGVDLYSAPYPPAATTEEEPFSLKDLPIKVAGDNTFEIKILNTSGAAITASSGNDMTATIAAIVEYLKK